MHPPSPSSSIDSTKHPFPPSSTSNLLSREEVGGHPSPRSAYNMSPRSNTIPMIELGRSLEQLRGPDTSAEFRSLDSLDGGAGGRDGGDRTQHYQPQPPSLDNMMGLRCSTGTLHLTPPSEFRKLGEEDKHSLILSLLPLLKPFAAKMDRLEDSLIWVKTFPQEY